MTRQTIDDIVAAHALMQPIVDAAVKLVELPAGSSAADMMAASMELYAAVRQYRAATEVK